jgi:hypothetical protein
MNTPLIDPQTSPTTEAERIRLKGKVAKRGSSVATPPKKKGKKKGNKKAKK